MKNKWINKKWWKITHKGNILALGNKMLMHKLPRKFDSTFKTSGSLKLTFGRMLLFVVVLVMLRYKIYRTKKYW